MEERTGPVDGGRAGGQHLLRAGGAVLLPLTGPAAGALLISGALRSPHPSHRLAALAFWAAAAAVPWGALAGSGSRPVRAALLAAGGLLICLVPAAAFSGADPGEALAAGAALGAFVLCLSGTARAVTRLTSRPAAGAAAAALAGCLAVASFHLGDPFLEWGGTGAHSPAALAVLHAVNPLSGAVGDALALDFLRLRIFYSGFPGSLEGPLSAAQYYTRPFFPWWGTALLHGGIGAVLLVSFSPWTKSQRGPRSTSGPRNAP